MKHKLSKRGRSWKKSFRKLDRRLTKMGMGRGVLKIGHAGMYGSQAKQLGNILM